MMRDGRQAGSNAYLVGGFVVTVLLHGGLVASLLVGRHKIAEAVAPLIGTVVDVQAVKFGKPRDMSFLPHKEAPVVREKPKLQLTDNDKALPRLKDDKKDEKPIEDPLKRTHTDDFKKLLEKENATGSAEEEGDPNGIKGGSATEGKGPVYYQHLQAAIQNVWVVPTTISESALANLKAMACMKIDREGKLTDFNLRQSSGNKSFDATLLDAIASLKEFEPPTPDVRRVVTTDGVCMIFQK